MDERIKQAYLEWDEARRMLALADELRDLASENERLSREKYEMLLGRLHRVENGQAYPKSVDEYREWELS